MNTYPTGIHDIDFGLLDYLSIKSIINLTQTNKYIYDLINNSTIYRQLQTLKTIEPSNRLIYSVRQGYLGVIKLYNNSGLLNLQNIYYLIEKSNNTRTITDIKIPNIN